MTDIEIFSKESKLVSLRSPPQKGAYNAFICFLLMIMIFEYGLIFYILKLIEKYTSITFMTVNVT